MRDTKRMFTETLMNKQSKTVHFTLMQFPKMYMEATTFFKQ